ncbi:MAG: hypothetical protein MSJ26_10680 [Oscillospiraceae bacterium]|nr:hypothetical protein [Oscillospiraceae bacterium]
MTVNVQKRRSYRVRRVSRPTPPRSGISPARRIYLLLTAISASGVFIGACSRLSSDVPFEIKTAGFADSFFGSLTAVMLYVGICFFSGMSSAGSVCGYLLCLIKGMGAGYLSAELLGNGLAGADICSVLNVLPFEAVSMAAVIFAARENIRMSQLIFRRSFGSSEKTENSAESLKLYLMKFGVIILLAAGAALIDGVMAVIAGNIGLQAVP